MAQGENVHLRLVEAGDLPVLERLLGADPDAPGEFEWRGFRSSQRLRRRFQEEGLIDEEGGILAVDPGDGETAGLVNWHRVSHGPGPGSKCWNIGIVLIPEWRGKGLGSIAQRLLADYLFETTPVQRIEAGTDVDNHPEQRALEKAGFEREGVLRSAQFRGGRWRDIVLYSRLREDVGQERP